jgi:hypothetical protein
MIHHIAHQAHTPALHERKFRQSYNALQLSSRKRSTFCLSFLTCRSAFKGRLQLVNLCLVNLQLEQVIVPILEESLGAGTSN